VLVCALTKTHWLLNQQLTKELWVKQESNFLLEHQRPLAG